MRKEVLKYCFGLTILLLTAGVIFISSCERGNGNEFRQSHPPSLEKAKSVDLIIRERYKDTFSRFAEKSPERIVSIAPSTTELLFEYGVGNLICGATEPHDFPPEASKLESVGNVALNMEKIVSLKPDIIIGERNLFLGQTETLRELGIPLMLFDTRDVHDVFLDLMTLDMLFKQQKADNLYNEAIKVIENVPPPEKGCRVAIIVSSAPMILAAGDSFLSSLISYSGGVNIAGDISGDYVTLSREELITRNPELILYTFNGIGEELMRDASLKAVAAIKENRMIEVDPDIFLRPTLRSIKEGGTVLRTYCHKGK